MSFILSSKSLVSSTFHERLTFHVIAQAQLPLPLHAVNCHPGVLDLTSLVTESITPLFIKEWYDGYESPRGTFLYLSACGADGSAFLNVACRQDETGVIAWQVQWDMVGSTLTSAGDDGAIRVWAMDYDTNWCCIDTLHEPSVDRPVVNEAMALVALPAPATVVEEA